MIGSPKTPWSDKVRQPGTQERETFLSEYAPLVRFVAARLASRLPREASLDDLVGDGLLGLLEAVQRFEPEKGVQFSTFAESRIRGAMLDGLRQRDFFPRSVRRRQREVEETLAGLTGELGRPPSEEEISARLGIGEDVLRQRLDEARSMALLPLEVETEAGHTVSFLDHAAGNAADPMEKAEALRVLRQQIVELPQRDRLVLSLYYVEGMTLKEIGAILSVTESRVCQIHTRAVLVLRGLLRQQLTAPPLAASEGRRGSR